MRASIEAFVARSGDKILILGEMKELGEFSKGGSIKNWYTLCNRYLYQLPLFYD